MGVEEFAQQFPKEVEGIESLGYKITSAFDGFGSNPVEIRLKKATMNETLIREYISTILRESFLSHSYEPIVGDAVINTNPQCKHYKSKGVVVAIDALPGDAGKTILYQTTNGGDNWDEGDVLEKTMDQLDQDS